MGDGEVFDRSDTARLLRSGRYLVPGAGVAFTHLSTVVETTIDVALSLGMTTAVTSAAVIIATTKLQDSVNNAMNLINNITYILKANSLSS